MKKKTEKRERRDELRGEYDLSELKGGVRGKYIARYRAGTNLVLLSPDVAELGFGGRNEPDGSGGDGENEVQGGAAGMVFEVGGEVFKEEFAEIHAESVAQNSRLLQGLKPIAAAGFMSELKLRPPKEKR